MTAKTRLADWQAFVIAHGSRALAHELAAIVGQSVDAINALRRTGACTELDKPKNFAELFTLWHGREPADDDWPPPRRVGANGTYEWQPPEDAMLATLVGLISQAEIVDVLTARLREKTGDQDAERNKNSVQVRTNLLGMQTTDVVGGLTTAQAAKEIGSLAIVNQIVNKRQLPTRRVGRLHVISYADWEKWKATRIFAPEGYVRLTSIREALGIRSDKLSEFARMELIPTAIRCNPYGTKGKSTQFGTWWISQETADKLVADRRTGLPMPWHGKYADNLKTTFKLWEKRKHPASCSTCASIWGEQGAPSTFEDYSARYPGLAHGAKRHLTREWTPGLTLEEVAQQAKQPIEAVRQAVENSALAASADGDVMYVTRTDATRWITRKCPTGESPRSWISIETASETYLFTMRELRQHIEAGSLAVRDTTAADGSKVEFLSRNQCTQLRERIGFTEEQAAAKLGITVERFKRLLDGVDWRQADKIPLDTVKAVRKRLESKQGYTIEEAAAELDKPLAWVHEQIKAGVVRVARAKWDRRRVYLTDPMMKRLRKVADQPPVPNEKLGPEWLPLSDAALEAGVSLATVCNWTLRDELAYREEGGIRKYHRAAVRARARKYWPTARRHRATPPAWLTAELAGADPVGSQDRPG